jgi:hypothetical protein
MLTDALQRRSLRSLVSRHIPHRKGVLATFLGSYALTSFVSRLLPPLADHRSSARCARLVSRLIPTMRTLPPALDLYYYVSRPIPTTSLIPISRLSLASLAYKLLDPYSITSLASRLLYRVCSKVARFVINVASSLRFVATFTPNRARLYKKPYPPI